VKGGSGTKVTTGGPEKRNNNPRTSDLGENKRWGQEKGKLWSGGTWGKSNVYSPWARGRKNEGKRHGTWDKSSPESQAYDGKRGWENEGKTTIKSSGEGGSTVETGGRPAPRMRPSAGRQGKTRKERKKEFGIKGLQLKADRGKGKYK